jgi:drug/metabolite transporter (DMT)-like permease
VEHVREHRVLGNSLALATAACTGGFVVLAKAALEDLEPLQLAVYMFPMAVAANTLMMTAGRRWSRLIPALIRSWTWMAGFSLLFTFGMWAYWSGLKVLDPTVTSFLSRSETLVTIILGILVLRERFHWMELIGGALVLAGLVTIRYTVGVDLTFGFWLIVISAICFGLGEVIAKVAVRRVDPLVLCFVRNLVVAVLFGALAASHGFIRGGLGGTLWAVVGVALTGPVVARYLYVLALQRIDVSKAALINQSQPLFVAMGSLLFLGVVSGARDWLGGGLIIVGCVLLFVRARRGG